MSNKRKRYFISRKIDATGRAVYNGYKFAAQFFKEVFQPPFHFKEVVRQCYEVGYRSLLLITLTGFVIGVVFTKQSRPSLVSFGATAWLPSLITIAIIRALAPLVTA